MKQLFKRSSGAWRYLFKDVFFFFKYTYTNNIVQPHDWDDDPNDEHIVFRLMTYQSVLDFAGDEAVTSIELAGLHLKTCRTTWILNQQKLPKHVPSGYLT